MTAKVGIFWVHRGTLIAVPVPVAEGADDGLFVNGLEGHAEVWEHLQRQNRALRAFEYDAIPRGRVLLDKGKHHFLVYLDRTLLNQRTKRAVLTAFSLPATATFFGTDAHYTTVRAELDRLFGDG